MLFFCFFPAAYSFYGYCAVLTFISSFKSSLCLIQNALIAAPQTNLATELFTAIKCDLQYSPLLFTEILECTLHKHCCFITLYHTDGLK